MLRTTLDDTGREELRQVARQAIGRVSERAHFVLLSAQGYSPSAIGALMGYDAQTVRTWLHAYWEHGGAGLADAPRGGRPGQVPHLTAVVQAQASQPPPNSGYLQACWTVALLVLHLAERFRIGVRPATVRRALHRAGFRWKRPKFAPARRRDLQADAKQAQIATILADAEANVVAADECDMHLLAVLRAMWQRLGQQLRLPTPGQNAKRGVFGALNLRTGQWFYRLTEHKRSADFMAFLTTVLAAYPVGRVYVLVDNASIHTSRSVQKWLTEHVRLELVYLPTYSGHRLNPVEKVWWDLKDEIAANRCFQSLAELDAAIRRYFAGLTPADLLALANCEVVRMAQAAAKT